MFTTVDLFAGAGGITEGFRMQGDYKCVCATDFDEEARHTFTYNHPEVPYILKDIKELEPDEILEMIPGTDKTVDVITGGPPCQGFSLLGPRLADDPRNQLFKEYIRIANVLRPKVIFFENVYGIMTMQKGKVVEAIVNSFADIGYRCQYRLVNAADYGVPQARPRFVLIGVSDPNVSITFPQPTHGKVGDYTQLNMFHGALLPYVTVDDALSDLPEVKPGEGSEEQEHTQEYRNPYQEGRRGVRNPGMVYCHRAINHSEKIQTRYFLIPQGSTSKVLPPEMNNKKNNLYRLKGDEPARTVTCCFRMDLIHPHLNRGLTTREAARLQSFDDDYRFFGNLTRKAKFLTQDDQVGNAVPPLLAYAFAKHIKNYILPQFEDKKE